MLSLFSGCFFLLLLGCGSDTSGGSSSPSANPSIYDQDNDTILDTADTCSSPTSQTGWTSNSSTDHDRDGCRDEDEDTDDDNDNLADDSDTLCPKGIIGPPSPISTAENGDYDGDGCKNNEDRDDDNDGVDDGADECPRGVMGTPNTDSTAEDGDHDSDGCRNNAATENDDDDDGISDEKDKCPRGRTGWTRDVYTDPDGDGCHNDEARETDDDGDGVADEVDRCPRGMTGWSSGSGNDNDKDGCRDRDEDPDDDNDGIQDLRIRADGTVIPLDICPFTFNPQQNANDSCVSTITRGDIDEDDDGLIDVNNISGLESIRTHPSGIGRLNEGCPADGCNGFELNQDIDLTGEDWIPIAKLQNTIFEGNNYTIEGLTISRSTMNNVGLFSSIQGAAIRNLNLDFNIILGDERVGGLAGWARNSRMENVHVSFEEIRGRAIVGGLVGLAYDSSSIVSSHVSGGLVQGNGTAQSGDENFAYTGGLIGVLGSSSIINASYANVTEIKGSGSGVAGLAGAMQEDAMIRHSFAISNSIMGEGGYVAGLVGSIQQHGTIASSYSESGRIQASAAIVGGLVGGIGASAEKSFIYASYAITENITGTDALGGLVGFLQDTDVFSSYAHTKNFYRGPTSDPTRISGLIGLSVRDSSAAKNRLRSSYAVGKFTGEAMDTSIAGLVHYLILNGDESTELVSSYWDKDVSGKPAATSDSAKNTVELQNSDSAAEHFAAWQPPSNGQSSAAKALWCDTNLNGVIDMVERVATNPVWEFGTHSQYPTINCTPGGAPRQHAQLRQSSP